MRSLGLLVAILAARALAAPVVFSASDPVAPGETVLAVGEGFGDQPRVTVARLPDTPPSAPGKAAAPPPGGLALTVLQPANQSCKFSLPATSKPGVFVYRLSGPDGVAVGVLNRPVVYWLQGDTGPGAAPGGWVRLFGRNLGWPAGFATQVLLKGPRTVMLAAKADVWSAQVALPKDVPAGSYQVWLHNGAGGDAAWSAPTALTVAAAERWPDKVFSPADHGVDGSGLRDDTGALQATLDAAGAAGGGVVLLPRGRYQVTGTLTIPRFVTLRGASRDQTCLFWPDTPKPVDAMVRGANHFGVEDLTLYASNHRHVIVGDLGDKPGAGHVRLQRVRTRCDAYRGHLTADQVNERFKATENIVGGDSVRLGGVNVEIADCDFYGSGRALYLMRVRGGRVHDNRFYNGRWGWYCISGSDGLIFERNQLAGADLMSTGGGLNCLDGSRYSQNVWYAGNDLRHMNGWDRESMTSDAGGGPYIGKVTAGDGAQLTLASEPKWGGDWSGAGVFVLQGKGAGQIRRVTRHAGAQVILDRPLDVPLDATSELTITQYQGHYLLVGNRFADCGAMQFFGTGIENIVAGNQAERMQGLHAWALWYYGFQPCFYVQFHDNRLSGSYYHWSSAGDSFIGVSGHLHEGYNGPLNLGSVVRRNTLRDNAGIRVNGAVRDALVEGNDLADCDTGVFVSGGCTRVLVRGNRFARVKRETADEDAERRAQAERLKRFLELKDPVASWDFEALANGRFADGAGNRFDARPEGTVKVVADGRKGKAAAFDGTGWLRVDEPAVFNAPNLTIDFWVRPSKLSGRFGLVTKRFNGCGCPFVVNQSGASIGFEAAAPEGNWPYNFTGPPALAAGKWTRVTVVLAEGKGVCLYLDGRPAAEKLFATPRQANGEPLIIGREAWGGDPPKGDTPGPFVGTLDELRIWTRALSAAEVAGLG